jgi:hypothetical protein
MRIIAWRIEATTEDGVDHSIADMPNRLARDIDEWLFEHIEPNLNSTRVQVLEAQIKQMKEQMEVCAYGKRELMELMALEEELYEALITGEEE